MNYELIFVEHIRAVMLALVFSCVAAVCIRGFWRRGNRISWMSLFSAFSFSVAMLWITSELFHRYAYWRVSVYDANGDQFFSNDGRLDDRLYSRLLEIAVDDTGNALQPLGAIVVSALFAMLAQGLAFLLMLIRVNIDHQK